MTGAWPFIVGAGVLATHALALSWLRWRQRKHRYLRRYSDGGVIKVDVLGPFKRKRRGR